MNPNYKRIDDELTARLDFADEYRALGLDIVDQQPDSGGWLRCRVFGEEDRTPSAAVNVNSGFYINHRTGIKTGFFDFYSTVAGKAADWKEAKRHFCQRLGIDSPDEPDDSSHSATEYFFTDIPNRHWCLPFCLRKPGITAEALLRNGAKRLAISNQPDSNYIAFPIFGKQLTADKPVGWQYFDIFNDKIFEWNRQRTCKNKNTKGSKSGLVGKYALENIADAKIVLLTEGIPDMLAADSAIFAQQKTDIVALTHSGGCGENPSDWKVAPLRDKTVIVVPDADVPGQKGGEAWATAAAAVAASVKIIKLPYEITENHGKDLRDYLTEGHTIDDLLALAEAVEPLEKTAITNLKEHQSEIIKTILDKYNISVSLDRHSAEINITGELTTTDALFDLCKDSGMNLSRDRFDTKLRLLAENNTVNRLLDHLPTWDNIDRIPQLVEAAVSFIDRDYAAQALRYWYIQTAVQNLSDKPKAGNGMLVLTGKQGIGKSTLVRKMSLGTAAESRFDLQDKDCRIELTNSPVCEIAELAGLRRQENEALKSFITKTADEERRPYAREAIKKPRRTAYIGTTNDQYFLTDRSGARRFWIFEAQIDRPKLNNIDFRQLWAQAVVDARELVELDLIPISQQFVDWTIDRGKNNTPTDNNEVLFEEFLENKEMILASELQHFCNENNIRLSNNVKSELLHKHLFVRTLKRIEFTENPKRVWIKNFVTDGTDSVGYSVGYNENNKNDDF